MARTPDPIAWFWQLSATAATPSIGRLTQAATVQQPQARPVADQDFRVFGSYAMVYIQAGHGRYRDANGTRQALGPGDVVFVSPRLGHRYGPNEGGWVQTYLVFDGPVFDHWHRDGWFGPRQPVRHAGDTPRWSAALREVVFGTAGSPAPEVEPDPLGQIVRLQALLAKLPRPKEGQAPRTQLLPEWATEAARRLGDQLGQPLDMEALAHSLHVSYTTFRRGFTQAYGMPPARYRAARTLDHARELIRTTRLTDQQIAHRLGFSDPQHFSKRFKQLVGRTPSQFRASL
ncbi:MAG: AraC family transcriptional regulator [Planctomycetota bacterium]